MTDEQITDPTYEKLASIESELGQILTAFFSDRGIVPAVGLSVMASLVGRGLHAYSDPADTERTLEMVFRSIRYLAEGGQAATQGH